MEGGAEGLFWRRVRGDAHRHRTVVSALSPLRKDLVRALMAFAAALLLILAWQPWTLFGGATSTAACGIVVSEPNGSLHVAASGSGASGWCGGEINRLPAQSATTEAASVTAPSCDFYVGGVRVTVEAANGADAAAFCDSLGGSAGQP